MRFPLPSLNRNEQYYEAILGIWNQLYINIKSLISWQYCLKDINYINSLTITMVTLLFMVLPIETPTVNHQKTKFLRNAGDGISFSKNMKTHMHT